MKLTKTLRVLPALLALPATASAATILFTDTFETAGNLNSSGWYFRHSSSDGRAWFRSETNVNSENPTGGSMGATTDAMQGSEAYRQFESVTLDTVGSSLTVSLDYRMTKAHATGGLQLAFLDLDTTLTENLLGKASPGASRPGYAFRTNTSSATAPTASYLNNEPTPPTPLSSGLSTVVIGDNAPHKISFTISLVAEGLLLSGKVDSVSIDSYLVTGVTSFTADTLRINLPAVQLGTGQGVYFDNITVEFTAGSTIPEPAHASLLLGGLALAGFVLRRPRRG